MTVLSVACESAHDRVRSTFDAEGFRVHTESAPDAALDRLVGVDCVVSEYSLPDRTGLDLLAAVRQRHPTLPFLLVTDDWCTSVVESLRDDRWATLVEPPDSDAAAAILRERLRRLVTHHRTVQLAGQALTAIETGYDGVALVGPDGTFQFVNQTFASALGYDAGDLYGHDWRDCYPPDEVERLERTALNSVAEGWLWTGGCRGLHADGETVPTRTRISGLADGSMVILLRETDDGE